MQDGISIRQLAQSAKDASVRLALTSSEERNRALSAMADALRANAQDIIKANEADMQAAAECGTTDAMLDRLMLDEARIEAMALALEELVELPDPLGTVDMSDTLYNGIELRRVRVPLGVVAVVYEARPNVTADAAGIALKSGNACVLRGGSLASHTNEVVVKVLSQAATDAGMPENAICAITTTDRSATDELMQLHGIVDVLIPRGGAGLIRHCVETSKVPVIETGTGNCHIYVEKSADPDMALDIVLNAKCRRYGVCNAAETLLVDEDIAADFIPQVAARLAAKGVLMHCDKGALEMIEDLGIDEGLIALADKSDWETEYLAPEIAIKCVGGTEEAIGHINRYGTHHSEAIVTRNGQAAELFERAIDAAAVYVNASTAFTDGGQFGLGAEIGISTQKLHARGPFALDALTSYKYVLRGDGQIRE